jgi:protein farnesyltransferase/geranylgeranyltransferase type-1 subunit alpha
MSVFAWIRAWLAAIFFAPFVWFSGSVELVEEPEDPRDARMPKFYHDDEAWADIEPLPQNDGGPHPLAAIAYTEEYSEAMDYLRAVMACNEFSDRVLALTEHIISMNPAHYTVWWVACIAL